MKLKKELFLFLTGTLLGAIMVGVFWNSKTPSPIPPATESVALQAEQLQKKLEATEKKLAEEMARSVRLDNKISQLERERKALPSPSLEKVETASTLTPDPQPPAVNILQSAPSEEERFDQIEERHISSRTQRDLEQLSRLFPLSGERLTRVEELLEQKNRDRIEQRRAQAMGENYVSPTGFNFEAELAKVLTPQEYETYIEYDEKVTTSRVETIATAQLNRITPALNLSEAQENEIYSLYYYNAYAQFRGEPGDNNVDAQIARILTPEQLEIYHSINRNSLIPGR